VGSAPINNNTTTTNAKAPSIPTSFCLSDNSGFYDLDEQQIYTQESYYFSSRGDLLHSGELVVAQPAPSRLE
jgi:hypothetical protein